MHLLFATSIVPDGSLASGYEIANEAIVDALRRAGVRVTILGFTWPGRKPSNPAETIVLGEVDVRNDSASAMQKVRWLAEAMKSGLTASSAKLRTIGFDEVRAAIRKAGPVDGYLLNSVQLAGAFEPCFQDKPFLFVAHNVEAQSAQQNARTAPDAFQRLLYRREAQLLGGLESRLCRKARFVYTLADEDRAALGVPSDERSAALPLVTRSALPAPAAKIACDATLIGTWTWQPNRVGLEWFLAEVAPHLPDDFTIRIAGAVPAGMTSSHPGVSFVGRVEDAHNFVRSGKVVPLISRGGTGVQLKTIETFELGLPSVATSSALRGIAYKPENCVVADEPAAFATALRNMAAGKPRVVDGSGFHRAQLAALDRAIAQGLDALRPTRVGAYA
ncbi:glycosyltransferase [Pseudaminobacter sp. 19-2017]|uniref:Glycosyltransferase n=1 Tax=Pseudaminobacter soli (ex Zhang et al. 2022) TaxID=2831468 RepID=A0A942DX39_9HYPH|nr:glycosyltransferase family 4 protein [Pseudaminobacter soli]MBS3648532.1 glycosyltransferase [Pseudaminobacter soli]